MTSKSDFLDALRTQTLTSPNKEERVEVNQRHLIDKILSRYSAEFVVYRELMQNADDAHAKKVEIFFGTESPNSGEAAPNLNSKIKRVIFKNNGDDFLKADWDRLKKIAEGNPDENKIGAFGVGFYSLFSICDGPFVSSGKECMAFCWEGQDKTQLCAKRALVSEEQQQNRGWTVFFLDLREPMDMVDMGKFGPFIARSLGFTGNLHDVTVYLDDHQLLNINKTICESRPMTIPNNMQVTSPLKMFTLKTVDLQNVQMNATRLMISGETRKVRTVESQTFLRTASGNLDVSVSDKDATEMERATKKYPPKQTTLQLLYYGYDEAETEAPTDNKAIFKDLLPFPEQGRIFIGFPTHQTTGFCGHVAGRFIPTVERENLDFVDNTLKVWNHELLSMAGLLSRMMYEDELAQIGKLYDKAILPHSKPDNSEDEGTANTRKALEKRALHVMKAFQLRPSTPEPLVGEYIDTYFFKMSKLSLSVLSSHGVKELSEVRIPDEAMSGFMKNLPILPTFIYDGSQEFMSKLETDKKVQKISFHDVLKELESRTLTMTQMVAMLRWWVDHQPRDRISDTDIQTFLEKALVYSGDLPRSLSTFKWFVNPILGESDVPLPPKTLPYNITNNFERDELQMISSVWHELSLHEWATFVAKEPDFETSPDFAEKVLHVLSRGWANILEDSRKAIASHLATKKCIPTKDGMMIPKETYLKTVTLFSDLLVMEFKDQPLDELLLAMGTRQSVEPRLVLDQLEGSGDWDHMKLITYFASVRKTLSEDEITELRGTPIFPRASPSGATTTQRVNRHLAKALYAPTETHIGLELPVIEWKNDWDENSDEAKLLFELGLEKQPLTEDLLQRATPSYAQAIRVKALQHLIDNFTSHYSKDYNPNTEVAFLPTTDGKFQTPFGCFSNAKCSVMGFPILHQDQGIYATLLGVKENPSPEKLLDRLLESPLTSKDKAQQVFEYLHSVQASFLDKQWETLKAKKFIPLDDTGKTMADPQSCYFYRKDLPYRDLLNTVDFGPNANRFLKACGVKENPSPIDLAQLVARSPQKFYDHEGVDRYRSILRQIATHLEDIKSNKSLLDELRRSPFLLGEITIQTEASGSSESMADGRQDMNMGPVVKNELALASDIYLVDDCVLQQIFNPLCAPMEELLESLYESLGSAWISEKVEDKYEHTGQPRTTDRSYALQARIEERAPLLLGTHSKTRLTFDLDWLTTKLKVYAVSQIQLRRKFIPTTVTKSEDATVCIVQDRKGIHYLMIKDQAEMDYFDIADALAKLLLKRKKLNDSIWWTNLLSSSLENLKRKGFQVDRILNAKNAKIEAEKAKTEAETGVPAAAAPETPLTSSSSSIQSGTHTAIGATIKGATSTVNQLSRPHVNRGNTAENQRQLNLSLDSAIARCRPHSEREVRSDFSATQVSESVTNSYCDLKPYQSLKPAGKAGSDVKFYIHKDLNKDQVKTNDSRKSLKRFAKLLLVLAKDVFGLKPDSVHIMYDIEGQTIAFNRGGSLFFNWRFYTSLGHDEGEGSAVKRMDGGRPVTARDEGLIYWFFTIAHELAHNIVNNHDSKHEYYMSSFCERFLPTLITVMMAPPSKTT